MNPEEELQSQYQKIATELADNPQENLLCYNHKAIMRDFLAVTLSLTESDPKERIRIIKTAYDDFSKSLIKAQDQGERMEAGLLRRKKFMEKMGIEKQYQASKKIK